MFNMNNNEPIISKTAWMEEYKKLTSQYKLEEDNINKTFLQNDYHLSKIYKTLLIDDINSEAKIFSQLQKQLKFSINEAYSYISGKKISKNDTNIFQNKINKIDQLILKITNEYKTKFDDLIQEENSLQEEIDNFDNIFMQQFAQEQEDKLRDYYNQRINEDEDVTRLNKMNQKIINDNMQNYSILNQNKKIDLLLNKNNTNINFDIIDKYINIVISSNSSYNPVLFDPSSPDYISISDIEKLINKMNKNHLTLIKSKTDIINSIIDKKLGGINIGWQPKEHEEFLKLKTNYNNKINTYEFLSALGITIPYIPINELKNHILNYEKFSLINDVKKLLVNQYKQIKKEAELINKQNKLNQINSHKNLSAYKTKKATNMYEQQIKKQKVNEWRQRKQQEENEKKKQELLMQKQLKQQQKQIYLQNKMKNDILIDNYKRQKEEEEYQKELQIKQKKQALEYVSRFDIERIKQREDNILQQKINAKRLKSANNLRKQISYQNYRINQNNKMKDMQSKLFEQTTTIKNKKRNKFDPLNDEGRECCTMANNVLGRTAKGIPQWRQGL